MYAIKITKQYNDGKKIVSYFSCLEFGMCSFSNLAYACKFRTKAEANKIVSFLKSRGESAIEIVKVS